MITFSKIGVGLVSGLFASQLAIAQGPPSFSQLDADGSGALSKEEVTALYEMATGFGIDLGPSADAFFARLDTDENGEVSQEEFDNRPQRGG